MDYFNPPKERLHNVRLGTADICAPNDPGHSPERVGEEDVDGVHEGSRNVR